MSLSLRPDDKTPKELIIGQFVAIKSSSVEDPGTIRVGLSFFWMKLKALCDDFNCLVTLRARAFSFRKITIKILKQ